MARLTEKSNRRYELDWLRVLVIVNLVPWHAAWLMITIPGFSEINQEGFNASVLRYYVSFTDYWQMPILFFIAGIATYFSMESRTAKEYIRERFRRLLIPLLFYMVILHPILAYFWALSPPPEGFSDYFFRFWPGYFRTILSRPSPVAGTTMPGWGHMWFVAYLLFMSLIVLPLVKYLKKHTNRISSSRFITFIVRRNGIFLMAVPLILILLLLSPIWPVFQFSLYKDWAYFLCNLTVFVYGYLFCMDERLWKAVDKHATISLLLGIATYIIISIMRYHIPAFSTPAYTLHYMLFSVICGFHVWFWIVALLGLARRFLSRANNFLKYSSLASYPFYILHMVLITVIGRYITQLNLGAAAEFSILSVLTFAATLGTYELLVKRIKITRFLFGMKT